MPSIATLLLELELELELRFPCHRGRLTDSDVHRHCSEGRGTMLPACAIFSPGTTPQIGPPAALSGTRRDGRTRGKMVEDVRF